MIETKIGSQVQERYGSSNKWNMSKVENNDFTLACISKDGVEINNRWSYKFKRPYLGRR